MAKTASIWTENECYEVDLDDAGQLADAMTFKACEIKAKADPELFQAVADMLRSLAASATVRHGRWIRKRWRQRGGYSYLKCECGKVHTTGTPCDDIVDVCSECGKINESVWLNYCPNCGAKMDMDEEEKK